MSDEAERYAQLNEIAGEALDRPPGAERDAWLAMACGDDARLLEEVTELLAHGETSVSDIFSDDNLDAVRTSLEAVVDGATTTWLPNEIGSYRIVRQIGQGGMGIVYEATQQSPRRSVAIKLLHPIHADADRLRRFRQEAELLGRLHHPGIAQIFEASTFDIGRGPQPFIAMQFVDGTDIRTYCENRGLSITERVDLLARVAEAVEYAHEHGVIHRDLKPDNVLVNQHGQPQVLDFGIARAIDSTTALSTILTAQGQIVGTLGYMAPEQLQGSPAKVTPKVDVYALGVLAYELLTGRLPRNVADLPIPKAIALLADTDAPPAGRVDPALKGDLETILGTALEGNPSRRYQSASALANDLRRYLADEPIQARPPSRIYLARKFVRRHRGLVGGATATLLVAIAGAVIATGYAFSATARAAELERTAYIARIAAANNAIQVQDYRAARSHLDRTPDHYRGWEYDYLQARFSHHSAAWNMPAPLAGGCRLDHDGERLFALLADATIGSWDLASGRLLGAVALDSLIETAAAGWSQHVVMHTATGKFAASTTTGELAIGNIATGAVEIVPVAKARPFDWDQPGDRLLLESAGRPCIWDGEALRVITETPSFFGRFNHAGDRVALSVQNWTIALFDVATGDLLAQRWINDEAQDLAFSPDDRELAVGCFYKSAFVLDGESLEVLRPLSGHRAFVWSTTWTADGRAVTAAEDGTVRIWGKEGVGSESVYNTDVGVEKRNHRPESPRGRVHALAFPDDSHVIVAAEQMRVIPLHNPTVLAGHETFVYRVTFSPDGSMLASSMYRRGAVHVWDVHRARLLCVLHPSGQQQAAGYPVMAFSADNQRVGAKWRGLHQWNIETGEELAPTASDSGELEDLSTMLGRHPNAIRGPESEAVSKDGRLRAQQNAAGQFEIFERTTSAPGADGFGAAPAAILAHEGTILCVAFHPDGTRIATGGDDATVRVWDAHTFEELLVLRGHSSYVIDLEFSPDGSVLASASGDTTVRLWDTRPLHERRALSDR